jgi:hypothetical protein
LAKGEPNFPLAKGKPNEKVPLAKDIMLKV